VSGGSSAGAAGFCGPCACLGDFCFVVGGAFVRDCRELGLCKVGILGWSAGVECVGGRGILVTGLGRVGGESEGREEIG
jgi:hypothetical protein